MGEREAGNEHFGGSAVLRRDERGAAAVEFALLLPIVVTILFAMTTFGLNLSMLEGYESAAREGARYAAVNCQPRRAGDPTTTPCTTDMIARAINDAFVPSSSSPPVSAAALTVTIDPSGGQFSDMDCSKHRGLPIEVKWTQSFNFSTYPFNISLGTRTRTIKGVFRCE
jgi:Flp pilus assembly protein TadG